MDRQRNDPLLSKNKKRQPKFIRILADTQHYLDTVLHLVVTMP